MSLSAWEQQTLDSIKDSLAGSDPQLAAMLTTFAQVTSAEEMPVQEMILAGSRRTPRWVPRRRSLRKPLHRRPLPGGVKLQWAVLVLWVVLTVAMITVALTLSHGGSGGHGTCAVTWPMACSHPASG
jgi:hypothetical protein